MTPIQSNESPFLDLSAALVLVAGGLSGQERKAAQVLVEEVEKRTMIRWQVADEAPPGDGSVVIVLGQASRLGTFFENDVETPAWLLEGAGPPADGYRIRTLRGENATQIVIAGNDARGVLFGVGYLLRHLEMSNGSIFLKEEIKSIQRAALCASRAPVGISRQN